MSSEPEYVVERVVAKRNRRGKIQYQIKWKGCDDSENTWEPEENLNCQDLLEQFAREEAEKRTSRRGKRSSADSNSNLDRSREDVEKTSAKRQSLPRTSKSLVPAETPSPPVPPPARLRAKAKNGFEKGHVAEKLEGVTEEDGELLFLVRWKGVDEVELISSKIVRQHVPELVIDFYETRIIWNNASKKVVQ
uniref:Putative heterochromatin protein 1 n=1 Tax=Culex tarsalis TaxID=7177 RepID=A0A1Q3EZK3_CULTA